MNILMVLTSHSELGDTGKKTGFWLEEFAAPYYVLKDAGHEITLASPRGGQPPLDPKSDAPDAQTDATRRFKTDGAAQAQLATTERLSDIGFVGCDPVVVRVLGMRQMAELPCRRSTSGKGPPSSFSGKKTVPQISVAHGMPRVCTLSMRYSAPVMG